MQTQEGPGKDHEQIQQVELITRVQRERRWNTIESCSDSMFLFPIRSQYMGFGTEYQADTCVCLRVRVCVCIKAV